MHCYCRQHIQFRRQSKSYFVLPALFHQSAHYISPEFTCEAVADRSGSGDCFMGGLIYGLYNQHDPQQALNYATAAAFGKLQEFGDATGQDVLSVAEVKGNVF